MVFTEIFPNPVVKQVVFQIRFPNLFYLESRIGELQVRLMKRFPESSLIKKQRFVLTDGDVDAQQKMLEGLGDEKADQRIWQFKSTDDVTLNIATSSLSLTSDSHKTYRLGDDNRFRDAIEEVCEAFLEVSEVPILKRIGLRYIDECPVDELTNESFSRFYDSILPLERFAIEDVRDASTSVICERGPYGIRYAESLAIGGDSQHLVIDCDSWATDVPSEELMKVTDELHDLVSVEFKTTAKPALLDYMRTPKDQSDD